MFFVIDDKQGLKPSNNVYKLCPEACRLAKKVGFHVGSFYYRQPIKNRTYVYEVNILVNGVCCSAEMNIPEQIHFGLLKDLAIAYMNFQRYVIAKCYLSGMLQLLAEEKFKTN